MDTLAWRHLPSLSLSLTLSLTLGGCSASVVPGPEPGPEPMVTPPARSSIAVPGLAESVELNTDIYGISHLLCANDRDCYLALGYLDARLRFYTMDGARRTSRGRLATLLGSSALESDLAVRRYLSTGEGTPIEEAVWPKLPEEARGTLTAYAEGVNAFLADLRAQRNGARPSEEYSARDPQGGPFDDTLATIPDWDPLDSVAIFVAAEQASGDHGDELVFNDAARRFSPELFADLFLPTPEVESFTVLSADRRFKRSSLGDPDGRANAASRRATARAVASARDRSDRAHGALEAARLDRDRVAQALHRVSPSLGSNQWAVSGDATPEGHAIFAADPHWTLSNPSGLPVVLDSKSRGAGSLHIFGVLMPGLPVFMAGHNEAVAWSCTVALVDTTDIYLETLSADGQSVRFQGRDVPIAERSSSFEVAHGEPATRRLRFVPHHGPLVYEDLASRIAVTVRWGATGAPPDLAHFFDLARAESVDDAAAAMRKVEALGCNLSFADRTGRVGWRVAAGVPSRPWASPSLAPWLPLPGDGRAEWGDPVEDGFLERIDPFAGFIATANNAIDDGWMDFDPTNDGGPYLQNSTTGGFRHARIIGRLLATRGTHTASDSVALQADTYLVNGAGMVPPMLAALSSSAAVGLRASGSLIGAALSRWKYACPSGVDGIELGDPNDPDSARSIDSIGCTAFHVTLAALGEVVLADEFEAVGSTADHSYASRYRVLYRALARPDRLLSGAAIWDDVRTSQREWRELDIIRAFNLAGDYLTQSLGADLDRWRWGRVHTLTIPSYPSRPEWSLGPFVNDGGLESIDPSYCLLDGAGRCRQLSGSVLRMVVELAPSGPTTYFQLPAAIDLHRDSLSYAPLTARYLQNIPVVVPFTWDAQDGAARERIELVP
ncbi:MAG: penicillin acylase family protein [Deltaproteobacteria bacterium]|nr:penicillin acylase family protein [Deltaproteobacteria bacterium]